MKAKRYPFRDEASGRVYWLSFERMMKADVMGVIREGNRVLRRARDLEQAVPPKRATAERKRVEIVSDAMGFPAHQLGEFEADRKAHGFRGVEFSADPTVPEFIQVKCSSRDVFNRYMKHRGMADYSQKNGSAVAITASDLAAARKRVLVQYPAEGGKHASKLC